MDNDKWVARIPLPNLEEIKVNLQNIEGFHVANFWRTKTRITQAGQSWMDHNVMLWSLVFIL